MTPLLNCLYKRVLFAVFIVLFGNGIYLKAQFYNLPNDYSFSLLTERGLAAKDSSIHTGVKPYIHFFSNKYIHVADSHRVFKYINDDPAIDLVFYKHFFRVEPKKEKFKLRLDPLLNLEYGEDPSDKKLRRAFVNTRGVIASGYVGDKVYFESLFAESQSVFPRYMANVANATSVVPGQGRWKQFKSQGYDYAFSSGFVSVQALKNLNIQVGHGKHKIGNGYRSLLLSDNAFNYPYAKITQQWFKGRVQYSNIYSVFMNLVSASKVINPNTERLFQKKAGSFQYLSLNVNKSFNLGFFQGMIWQSGDERNKQHLKWQYFNPLIYTNLLSYGLDNRNNIVTGLDAKYKLSNKIAIYGQLMLDKTKTDSSASRWGWQGGINYFDALGVKNLFLQVEYNYVKKDSYLNANTINSDQSYSHYNQNLAYTPGSGNELVFLADYKIKRFFFNFKYNYQQVPQNSSVSESFSYINIVNAKVGYLINPAYNLNISFGMLHRTQNFSIFNTLNNETNYLYVAIRTSLYNLYYDF
ncbi:hypothetical protein CNR22_08115 [Sphingobacteriaceae bacterium]|nr:hypothetical protein CNR22_08115 [Sphingobacteriaceae bacterium]